MNVSGLERQFNYFFKHDISELSTREKDRLRALAPWKETGDPKLICQVFNLSRATLYRWEKVYITIRPHQALGYQTPLQFLKQQGIIPKKNLFISYVVNEYSILTTTGNHNRIGLFGWSLTGYTDQFTQ